MITFVSIEIYCISRDKEREREREKYTYYLNTFEYHFVCLCGDEE